MVLLGILRGQTTIQRLPEYIVESPFDLVEAEGIEEVRRIMEPCRNCGELRPRDDFSMGIDAVCHLCRLNPSLGWGDGVRVNHSASSSWHARARARSNMPTSHH